ncbi:MAG: T9SS type A sorting domain-containing protein [Flavobacteriales bacterium]|nr:T9SS type A sorting domain-containing protein [Flavobacteriales bacterium]
MKRFVSTVVVAISMITSCAQDFAPIGAEWYYNELFAFSNNIDYIKFTSEKDTLMFGETCRKIIKRHKIECNDRPEIEYLFTRNDTVFFLDTIFNEFQVLYDFNAIATSSWTIKIKDEAQNIDTLTITVDAVSTTQINGQDLKTLHVTYVKADENLPDTYTSTIIEKIGDTQYMFNWYPWSNIACDINYTSGLRCYQDSMLGWYSTGIADSCDYVYTWTGIDAIESSERIKLFPNPAQNFVEIIASDYSSYTIDLLDLSGRLLKSDKSFAPNTKLDLSTIPEGVYLIRLQNNGQIIGYKKLIKD